MMTGRQEHTIKTENTIERLLNGQPDILINYYNSNLENKTAKTKEAYIKYIIEYFRYLEANNIDPNDINSFAKMKKMDIDSYLASTKYRIKNGIKKENGKSIRRSKMFAIKSFYSFLQDNELIKDNPCNKVQLPKLDQDISVVTLTDEEIETVKSRIISDSRYPFRDTGLFMIGLKTGLRITEIIEINISDIDFDNNTILVTVKGDRKREIYFGDSLKETIIKVIRNRNPKAKTDALFVNQNGDRISYYVAMRLYKKYASDFGKKITPHKTRSTYATKLYDKTDDIYLVADNLGHRNISNTKRYANISTERKRKAADIMDDFA